MSMKEEDKLKHVMSAPVITMGVKGNLGSVARKMVQHNIGSVVVVDGKKLIGIVTERDITKQAIKRDKLVKIPVKKIMTKKLVTAPPEMSVQDAFELMLTSKIRRLPVLENDNLVGIVTEKDLMRWVLRVSYEPNIPNNIQLILDAK